MVGFFITLGADPDESTVELVTPCRAVGSWAWWATWGNLNAWVSMPK